MRRLLPAVAATLIAAPVSAETPRMVTNPDMCGLDPSYTQEMGMELDTTTMWEIEYLCEFDPAINLDWDGDYTFTRLGWCSEPGLITPILVTFQYGSHDPGKVYVWWQDGDEPTEFTACSSGRGKKKN